MSSRDPVEQNILGVQSLVGSKLNKVPSSAPDADGVVGDYEDAFTLKLDDEELIRLARTWQAKYQGYEGELSKRQKANKTYLLGRQLQGGSNATDVPAISANLLFEALETFIPAALAKNPEPVVWTDNTPEGNKLAEAVKAMLQYHADVLVLRRKLTLMTRNWSVDFLGVIKHGWDPVVNDIKSDVRDVKNFIFDPEGFIDPYGDYDGPLGERIKVRADKLMELFPKWKEFIALSVDGKLGTEVTYIQWWNDDYTFSTFKGRVLEKNKNPFYNYDTIEKGVDLDGMPVENVLKGKNHFARPKKPYTFLSVFSFGDQPHDVTGLIEQNIPNQRRISRRTDQIDRNISRSNNSDIFSENNFNQETAKQAADAIAAGRPVLIPQGGPIDGAIKRLQGQGIDSSVFNELENSKNDLRSIFGTQGISAQQPDEDQTARGMIINQQQDSSRIGGGIGDALEQVADNVFNWWAQLYYVFYDEQHFAAVMGQMRAVEYVTIDSSQLDRRVVISVSPNSMKPKDEVTKMNQAMALWDKGAIDPKTLLTILDFPDPQQTAAQATLWTTNPQMYMQLNFPDLVQEMQQQMMQQAAMAAGGVPPMGGAGVPPEGITEPAPQEGVSAPPASAALSQVPLPA
jgi:hypothetical protein